VEGISPEVYDRFMHPLRKHQVFPRILSLLELDKQYGKVHITTPIHKANLKEIPAIRDYFRGRTFRRPAFNRLENRSWDEGPWNELSLAPLGGHCPPEQMMHCFFVDWDGAVLACCSDFSKSNKVGDLREESIAEVLANKARSEMLEVFRTKQWCQKDACSRCRCDDNRTTQSIVRSLLLPGEKREQNIPPRAFFSVPMTRRYPEGNIHIDQEVGDGIVIYGPYQCLPPGRYRVVHFVNVLNTFENSARLTIDVNVGYTQCLKSQEIEISEIGPLEIFVDFEIREDLLASLDHDQAWSSFEFRIAKSCVEFVHKDLCLCFR